MKFDWDSRKARSNLKKHALSFEEAATVFYDPLSATFDDPDHSDEESRYITVGYSSQNKLCVVVHTEREDALRIISARQATTQERKRMKKGQNKMRSEYDFDYSKAVRGKYHKRLLEEKSSIIVLEPDVAQAFQDSKAVNTALRSLLKLTNTTRQLTSHPPR